MLKIDFHRDEQKQETKHSANIKACMCANFDIQYLQSKGRDKMLLIKVNLIKSLFRFFQNQWKGFKALSHWQKTLMLCVTGGIKTPLLQSLVSEQWAWFTNREERQRGRLIWSQQTGPVWIIFITEEQRGRGRSEVGGMEVLRSDICDQVIWLEAIPLTIRKRGGCYMVLVLYCSGDPELMGEVL